MSRDDEATATLLAEWASQLTEALDIQVETQIDVVLGLAGAAAHAVQRPAAPLTTYLVGYATGYAAATGADAAAAFAEAVRVATALAAERTDGPR